MAIPAFNCCQTLRAHGDVRNRHSWRSGNPADVSCCVPIRGALPGPLDFCLRTGHFLGCGEQGEV